MTDLQASTAETRRVVTGMYDAAIGGDLAGFFSHIAPEVVTHEPSFLPYGGSYSGLGALMELLGEQVAKHLEEWSTIARHVGKLYIERVVQSYLGELDLL